MLRRLEWFDDHGAARLIWRDGQGIDVPHAVLSAEGYTVSASTLRFMANTVERWEESARNA